jgi:hypothetical protein
VTAEPRYLWMDLEEPVAVDSVAYRNLEWAHLDKRKFVVYNCGLFFVIRALLYPANVVKTRFQVQKKNTLYRSATQTLLHTLRTGGVSALYAGFPTASLFLVVQQLYLFTYEFLRSSDRGWPSYFDEPVRNGLSAAVSVCFVQLLGNPLDIVSQRLMLREQLTDSGTATKAAAAAPLPTVVGVPANSAAPISAVASASSALPHAPLVAAAPPPPRPRPRARDIFMGVYRAKGLRGFYSGFGVSCAQFIPAASLWWTAYPVMRGMYLSGLDRTPPRWWGSAEGAPPTGSAAAWKARIAEVFGGATSSLFVAVAIAPLDVIRTRAQVEGSNGIAVARHLLATEGVRGLWKGAGARAFMLVPQGAVSVWAYEQVKRWSSEP